MGCCFSCSPAADTKPIPISSPPPPQSSISMAAVVEEEEEEEKVKEVVVVVSQTEIPSPPKLEMKDHIVKQLLLKKQQIPTTTTTNNFTAPAPQFQRTTSAVTSPLKQRRPIPRRTHSFSGDLSAVAALPPNQTHPPSRSHRHSGSYKIVQGSSLQESGDTSGRRLLAASSFVSQRSPSMRRTNQLSPMKARLNSNKRLENGNRKELKTAKRKNGSADTPSVSLECFIFL